jgi:hypothetical protein
VVDIDVMSLEDAMWLPAVLQKFRNRAKHKQQQQQQQQQQQH